LGVQIPLSALQNTVPIDSSPTLSNCIIWGNDSPDVSANGYEFYIDGGTTTLNYSCYENGIKDVYITNGGTLIATNNNITSDPQFVGSSINPNHPYSILGTSPCVDAGNDSYNSQAYDIRGAGYPRKLSKTTGAVGTIDMGAYEYLVGTDLLPVELTSFAASVNGAAVTLNWQTATEINNYGFEIQRFVISNRLSETWEMAGFVEGSGTTNAPKKYSFADNNIPSAKYSYRLKQIDRDGKFEYSQSVEATINVPIAFALEQNFPNPFNPSTTINYSIPTHSHVTLSVFNTLGQRVSELVNGEKEAGFFDVTFDASGLASGVYLYRMQAGSFVQTRKLVVVK
jgi:Secretion system C-terminal sorting domain